MFKNIIIGQYIPGSSPLHKINPAVKIALAFIYIIVLFFIKKPLSYTVFTVYVLSLVMISGISVKIILRGIRPMLWIFVITALLNFFMTPGEAVWFIPVFRFSISVTREGLIFGTVMIIRLLFLIVGTSLLTLTTSPLLLTDGIEKLLTPLKKIKVPAHEIAMMMTIAIRFIPTLAEETDKIMKAQTARGADFETGNIIRRAKAMTPLLIPLFVSAFRRADELATAMEARCYNGGGSRTKMKETRITKSDIITVIIFITGCLLLILTEFLVEI